jgi:transposase
MWSRSRRKRRHWSDEDKARIVAESWESGSSARIVAVRYGIALNQLFRWRQVQRAQVRTVPPEPALPSAKS